MDRRAFAISAAASAFSACTHEPSRTQSRLRVAGRPDVMEMGPVFYATEVLLPRHTLFRPGGAPNLFKDDAPNAPAIDQFDPFPGRADVAGQAETQALRLSVNHPDLRIIMTICEGLYRIIGRRSAGIDALADLAGKRIGVFENTSAAYFVHRMLTSVALSEADVTIVSLRPREMAEAITQGQVDAISIWEPESERAFAALGADAVTFSDPRLYRELFNLNTTAAALADPEMRAAIVRFMRALIHAARVSQSEPSTVWPLVARHSTYPLELVAASWPHHSFPAALPADLLDVLTDQEQWLAAHSGRTARTRTDLAQLIDPSVLAEALAR